MSVYHSSNLWNSSDYQPDTCLRGDYLGAFSVWFGAAPLNQRLTSWWPLQASWESAQIVGWSLELSSNEIQIFEWE